MILQSLVEYSQDVRTVKEFRGLHWEEEEEEESLWAPDTHLPTPPPTHLQVLGHPISEQHLPDVSLIGEFSDPGELGKLLQLVLGCAISCEKKQGMGG